MRVRLCEDDQLAVCEVDGAGGTEVEVPDDLIVRWRQLSEEYSAIERQLAELLRRERRRQKEERLRRELRRLEQGG